jgi:hypothetical protein
MDRSLLLVPITLHYNSGRRMLDGTGCSLLTCNLTDLLSQSQVVEIKKAVDFPVLPDSLR